MKKIWGTRFSLVGDIIMSLPILDYLHEIHGDIYTHFCIAQKCQQSLPLFLNQPLINNIKISDQHEGLGEDDFKIIKECDIVINVAPNHPKEQDWYNYRSCVEETALMAGFDPSIFSNRIPNLIQYWQDDIALFNNGKKTIVIWPFAGYGQGASRSPSLNWWNECINILLEKYNIIHAGVDTEPVISSNPNYKRITNLSFFEQVKASLNCDLAVGTDSGSMWVLGAYGKIPQINLITNWLPSHNSNLLSLAPTGKRTINMFGHGICDNINITELVNKINENICI